MKLRKQNSDGSSRGKWLRRLGITGFLFFLLKGLAWIGAMLWAWLEFG